MLDAESAEKRDSKEFFCKEVNIMSENQPREFDAVLGGGNQAPVDGVVLGGIEGVKRRWESANIQQKNCCTF